LNLKMRSVVEPKPIICLLTHYRNVHDRNQEAKPVGHRVFLRSGVIFTGTVLAPRFKKANLLVDLVKVLRAQHQAGRQVTDVSMRFANLQSLKNESERRQLIASMQQFIRMYNPHEAREDTVLFPAFRKIVSAHEFDALGEDFEKKEDELFGEDGFEKVVDKVAGIEKQLGIYDLAQFTPKM